MKRSLFLIGPFCVLLNGLEIKSEELERVTLLEKRSIPTQALSKREVDFVGPFPALGGELNGGKIFTTTASAVTQSNNLIGGIGRSSLKFVEEIAEVIGV